MSSNPFFGGLGLGSPAAPPAVKSVVFDQFDSARGMESIKPEHVIKAASLGLEGIMVHTIVKVHSSFELFEIVNSLLAHCKTSFPMVRTRVSPPISGSSRDVIIELSVTTINKDGDDEAITSFIEIQLIL